MSEDTRKKEIESAILKAFLKLHSNSKESSEYSEFEENINEMNINEKQKELESLQLELFKTYGRDGLMISRPAVSGVLEMSEFEMDSKNVEVEKQDLIPGRAWLFKNVLSKKECGAIVSATEEVGYEIAEAYTIFYDGRMVDRFESNDDVISKLVFDRVEEFLPEKIGFDIVGLNPNWRFCRYLPGHYFNPHIDGGYARSALEKSYLTIMVYLNSDFEGGSTIFYKSDVGSQVQRESGSEKKNEEDLVVLCDVKPEPGLALVFWQHENDLLHKGAEILSGLKYMMRTDVMFCVRDRGFCVACTTKCDYGYHDHNL